MMDENFGAAETTIQEHIERFWQTLTMGDKVRILVDIHRPESFGGLGHWDGSSFSDKVAKALVAEVERLRKIEAAATKWRRSMEQDGWPPEAIEDTLRDGIGDLMRLIPAVLLTPHQTTAAKE